VSLDADTKRTLERIENHLAYLQEDIGDISLHLMDIKEEFSD